MTHVRLSVFPTAASRGCACGACSRREPRRPGSRALDALPPTTPRAALRRVLRLDALGRRDGRGAPVRGCARAAADAERVWWTLGEADSPRGVRRPPADRRGEGRRPRATRRGRAERAAPARRAAAHTLAELAEANRAYEAKFGLIFIVCATGRSAEEMLADLRARGSGTPPPSELRTAAEEQGKITRLRLDKLIRRARMITTHVLDTSARHARRRHRDRARARRAGGVAPGRRRRHRRRRPAAGP